jgi:hypothetical protein
MGFAVGAPARPRPISWVTETGDGIRAVDVWQERESARCTTTSSQGDRITLSVPVLGLDDQHTVDRTER